MVEALGALVTGRAGRARAALGGVAVEPAPAGLAAGAPGATVAPVPPVGDHDVRRHQVRGLVGPRLQRLRVGSGRASGPARRGPSAAPRGRGVPVRGQMDVDPAAWSPATAAVAAVLAGVVVFGSRHLVTRYVPAVGELVPVGGGGATCSGRGPAGGGPSGFGGDAGARPPGVAGAAGLLGAVLAGQRRRWPARS